MKTSQIDFSSFPYSRFSDIRIRNNEPLTYAYLNSHIVRLCSNLESLGITNTLQRASYTQWGTVRKAKETDITDSENGDGTAVLTNDVLNRVMDRMKSENSELLFREGALNLSRNYRFVSGEFIVGTDEKIAKRITNAPSRAVFSRIDIVPVGFEDRPFHSTRKSVTDKKAFSDGVESSGVINFSDWNKPLNYNEFHVYYHSDGYVICDNGKIDSNQKQIKVKWTLLMRKD